MATARPVLVLLVCVVLAALSVWLTVARLQFRADRSELIDPTLAWQQRYVDFKSHFPRWDDAVIVVDLASAGDDAKGEAYLAALEARLRADPHHWSVTAGFPQDEAPLGMLLTEPLGRVKEVVAQLKQAEIVLTAPTLDGLLGLSALAGSSLPPEKRAGLLGLLQRAGDVGTADPGKPGPSSVLGLNAGTQRLITRSGKLATVLVGLKSSAADVASAAKGINTMADSVADLRAHLAALRAEPAFSGIKVGVTGVPVLESDETLQSTRDGERAGYLSLALIVLLMLVAYRGAVVPIAATLALLIGMAWSFAWATISIGHLQLLSVVFASFLMGLGIDVAIHIIARLELVAPRHSTLKPAIAQAFRGVGPGIVTATFTVAAAAGTMALTAFAGVGEMGIIAAGGVILCTVAVMTALPAMLVLLPNPRRRLRSRPGGEHAAFLGKPDHLLHAHPWKIVALASLAAIASTALAVGVRYDPNVQNLLPTGVESAVWQDRLEADDAKSVWHAVVVAHSVDEARDLTLKLRQLPEVADVEGVGMLFQPQAEMDAKLAEIRSLPDEQVIRLNQADAAPIPGALSNAAARIAKTWKSKDPALAAAAERVASLNREQEAAVQATYAADRTKLADTLIGMHHAEPVLPAQLPGALKEMMVGTAGELLLRVYPRSGDGPDDGVLSPRRLFAFAQAVLKAAPSATGPSIQIYESTRLITSAYQHAAAYALIAIFILLLIDFRSLADALCALMPVLFGAALMLAILRIADIALNFANLIVMPLIVGIGVGCGVHAVRRWRMQPFDPPPGLAGGSGRAITMTAMTTIIGFATLITGQHRGIRSLGLVMSTGLAMVWVVTILVLPAVLKLRTPRPPQGPGGTTESPAPPPSTTM